MTADKARWRLAAAIAAACVVVIGVFVLIFPKQVEHQLAISVVRQQTPYTQLYFDNPAALPARLTLNRSNEFSFTIANDRGHSETYHYIVTISREKSLTIVRRGSVQITNNGKITYTMAVVPRTRRSKYLVTVILAGTSQSIHFYGSTS